MEGLYGKVRALVSDTTGAIRDPAVSWDGQRVLFAWKKSLDEDDYHLYELNVASNLVRQITSGLGFADYEPAYLANNDIIFARRVASRPWIAGGRKRATFTRATRTAAISGGWASTRCIRSIRK